MADSDRHVGVGSFVWLKRWDVVCVLVVCVVVLVAFWEVSFGGKTFSTAGNTVGVQGSEPFPGMPTRFDDPYRIDQGASAWQAEPWAEVVNEAYGEGRLPLWNPYQGSGAPLAANMQSGAFDPLLLPVNLHPTPLVWDLTTLGAFLLGAVAMYAFGRVLGLGRLSATVSSVAFALSGTFFLYSNNPFVRSYCFLPVLFLLVELVIRSRRLLPVLGLGLATAANLLLGMPEISVVVIGMAGTYALVRVIMTRRTSVVLSAARTGGGFVLGFMLAAPLLMLLWEYVGQSVHAHTAENAVGLQSDPTHTILNLLAPFFA
ncbi:MAG TPA: hypothetical protein VJA46_07055, partial [Acidimicrobiia bacterium]|nr:hypothetical protein [Acidimicrobiia bacterium]